METNHHYVRAQPPEFDGLGPKPQLLVFVFVPKQRLFVLLLGTKAIVCFCGVFRPKPPVAFLVFGAPGVGVRD